METITIQNTQEICVPFHLNSGTAQLVLPTPISSDEFDYLKENLGNVMDGMKGALVPEESFVGMEEEGTEEEIS